MNITQIVLMLSSLWTANSALLDYVWYTSFSMCLYIFKFLRIANKAYFCLFYFDFASYEFAAFLIGLSVLFHVI